ncbi:MAG: Brp/Blh family beta-carotene 15,15'-dioxygenase [Flavobacteriales bacterium]|nr:Brp/Blh family beta-carotene 15,15'-dioxygenase [Flavobacteriales bacterium]
MSKEIFIFCASLLIILSLLAIPGGEPVTAQLFICSPFIFLLGIPHGAIDNVLYTRNKRVKNTEFLIVYSSIVLLNVALWFILPEIAYVLFLLISAYHFGQSQFTHHFKGQKILHQVFFMSWGLCIISALILFNLSELELIVKSYDEFAVFESVHYRPIFLSVFIVSSLITLTGLIFLRYKNVFSNDTVIIELLVLGLILFSFYLMPIIIGFTLYFVILHSLKVLNEEYRYLKKTGVIQSLTSFVKLLTPFSLISLLGLFLLFGLIHFGILKISFGYCVLIMISSITLPHVFVMDKFYHLLFTTKFYGQS